MASNNETVTTWADGFGRWHARVNFPAPGYDWDTFRADTKRLRAKARRKIRRELTERQNLQADYQLNIEHISDVVRGDMIQAVTYAEVVDTRDSEYERPEV